MPKPQKRTDRTTLSALLTCGKLTASEMRVFQGWYDDIMGGKLVGLSPDQRLWADSIYEKHKLGDVRFEHRKEARARVTKEERLLDKMPRPLKPPGRV